MVRPTRRWYLHHVISVALRRDPKATRHLGRAEARQIGANENPQRVEDTLWIECVGDAPVVVSPALSIGDA
ncbi:MAG: hypothetical protein KIG59_05135 [Muribaculaceae bacterium]|nr:hypothetical protein [Muribaculaceae bacterium]